MLYYSLNLIYSFILVGFFLLVVNICIHRLFNYQEANSDVLMSSLLAFYMILLVVILILSLGSDVKNMKFSFQVISTFFSIYMVFFIILLIQMFFNSLEQQNLMIPIIATVFGFLFILVLNNELCKVLTGIIQFLFVTPIYLNIFTIYSTCNIHDISWGNRASEVNNKEKFLMNDFEKFRAFWTLFWVFINSMFVFLLTTANETSGQYFYYIGMVGMGLIYVRFVGGVAHFAKQKCCKYTFAERLRAPSEDFTDKITISTS